MIVCKSETFKPRKIESMQYRSRGRSNHITDTAPQCTNVSILNCEAQATHRNGQAARMGKGWPLR